jgi:hypothetical protein
MTMTEAQTEEQRTVSERDPGNTCSPDSRSLLVFLGLLSLSFIGYFAVRAHRSTSLSGYWMGLIFGHLAAVSIMGFYGCLAGAIANRKRYVYVRAFCMGFFLPILLGGISAFVMAPWEDGRLPVTCGGWVSLGSGVIVVISYLFVKRRDTSEQNELKGG